MPRKNEPDTMDIVAIRPHSVRDERGRVQDLDVGDTATVDLKLGRFVVSLGRAEELTPAKRRELDARAKRRADSAAGDDPAK